jgi:dTDP-4-dehydrorhamnose reductase
VGGRLATLLLAAGHPVVAGVRVNPAPSGIDETVRFDLADQPSIDRALDQARPDAVVHCAALADPDRCERDSALAEALNVAAPAHLARACRARGVQLVALSTDLVFAGDRAFAGEDDPAAPILTYGRTKLAGERAVLAEYPGAVALRVPLVVGRGHGARGTASEAIAWALRAGRPVRLFTDQVRTPVDPESIADAIARVLAAGSAGRFHLAGPERVSRHELGLRIAAVLGLPAHSITPVRQGDVPAAARRPADVSLDGRRAHEVLGWRPRPLEAGIRESRTVPD